MNYKSEAGRQAVMELYDKALANWPIPYKAATLPTRHGDTFAIICGNENGPPLLLLHGAGTNSAIWAGDVPTYEQQYRVYAVDLPGEAGKSAENRPSWEDESFTEWLEDVLAALHIEQVILAGISQGAWTSLKYTTAHPERVSKLVLMCPGGIIPDKGSFIARAVFYSLMGTAGMKRMIQLLYGSQPIPDGVEEITSIVTTHFKPRVGVLPIFSDEELARLTMPVALIGGNQDAMRDIQAIAGRLEQHLPDVTTTIIPGAGHALLNTSGTVMDFLGQRHSKLAV